MPGPPQLADLQKAAAAIADHTVRTPLVESPHLSAMFGRRVLFKLETLQRTGSFKFRGALNFVSRIPPADRPGGVVAFSSGNHAQGVAAAARVAGIGATIFMPADAPATKRSRAIADGADVIAYDRNADDREQMAAAFAEEHGGTLLPPYDHPWTIAGQGTVGLEIAADCLDLMVGDPIVLVPTGGGGLAAGIAIALEGLLPAASVHAVEPAGFDDHALSLSAGERVRVDRTSGSICDSLLAPIPGALTWEVNRRLLGGAHPVEDDEVRAAMRLAFEGLRVVVEPGGAVGLAALLAGAVAGDGPVVVVLSGGNVDLDLLASVLG